MHLDPNNERTPSNKKRLKLKGFHKRQILGKIIKNLFVKRKVEKPRKKYKGSGSGGSSNKRGCFTYNLRSAKKATYEYFRKTFNKQQLPGKLILIGKKYFRICSD